MTAVSKAKTPLVLLVEDNPDDQYLAAYANRKLDSPCEFVMADDGVAALDYLEGASEDGHANVAPDLVLVDLSMPRMDGLSLLQTMRESAEFATTPVVVFTTSTRDRDVADCYAAGCNSYVVKPMTIDGLTEVLAATIKYWFRCVTLPA